MTIKHGTPPSRTAAKERIEADMRDSFDEELELEMLDDEHLGKVLDDLTEHPARETLNRQIYFRELFRLQRELVKLQDWAQTNKRKVVVIFEGRDSAGKGGVIKRITQRLNPRVCRVAALPAPNERERTQWYFQRYVAHLPSAGEIVLFDRSWYNRAGVERVTSRTSRERTSGENLLLVCLLMAPPSQELEPPANPGRFRTVSLLSQKPDWEPAS